MAYNVTKGPYTITTPGTYPYFCSLHSTTMVGTIVVVAGSGAVGGGASSSTTSSTASSSSGAKPANALPLSIVKGSGKPGSTQWFSPQNATVVIGVNNTLIWTNDDTSAHTVTSVSVPAGAATFNSGILAAGVDYRVTLTVPGTYQYYCSLHSWMVGTIIVKSG
jgi:plastocyanin